MPIGLRRITKIADTVASFAAYVALSAFVEIAPVLSLGQRAAECNSYPGRCGQPDGVPPVDTMKYSRAKSKIVQTYITECYSTLRAMLGA